MYKTKQISAKIDEQTIADIDLIAQRCKYWTRNGIINAILTTIVETCDYEQIMLLVRYWKHDPTTKPLITISKNQGI